jgi:hypothetical protein
MRNRKEIYLQYNSVRKAGKSKHLPRVRSACFQQFAALETDVEEVSWHCWKSRCYNELYIVILLKVVYLWDVRIYFLSLECNFIHVSNKPSYSSCHEIASFKATEGLHPSYRAALSHQYRAASFATLRVLSCLHWAPLFVFQRCTILLWPWSMKFGDGYYNWTKTVGPNKGYIVLKVDLYTEEKCISWTSYESTSVFINIVYFPFHVI